MNDPHVEAVHYRLIADGTTSFAENVPPVDYSDETLTARLEDGQLTVRLNPEVHCESALTALLVVSPFVRAWEISSALTYRRPEVRFEYLWAEVVDRSPPPPGDHTLSASAGVYAVTGVSATLSVERGEYPAPPNDFAFDADVETLYNRWATHLDGRQSLQDMANFCLTVLEHAAGDGRQKRKKAAAHYRIDFDVLKEIGRLAAHRGDALTARKMTKELRPLEPEEGEWLEAAGQMMILRAGEVAAQPDRPLPQLTLADLPPLP